jgi:hypothetical protein
MKSFKRAGLLGSILLSWLLAGCGGGGSTATTVPVTTTSKTVSLIMNTAWTDTGMAVTKGQSQVVTATGKLNWLTDSPCVLASGSCVTTPAGLPWSNCATRPAPAYTAPGLACWSLIGKIGSSGTPFEVGTAAQINDSVSGELYLGINDNVYHDDTGDWTATITEL